MFEYLLFSIKNAGCSILLCVQIDHSEHLTDIAEILRAACLFTAIPAWLPNPKLRGYVTF